MPSACAFAAKRSNALRGSWMASILSGNSGRRVKQGVASVVRNPAGCAAIGTLTALRISRVIAQHAIGFLLTVDAHGGSARIHHGSRTVRWCVPVGTLA